MTKTYRKIKVEHTGKRVLPVGENIYMGGNYHIAPTGAGTSNNTGVGPPSGTANPGSIYIDTNTGAVYYFYSGAWH